MRRSGISRPKWIRNPEGGLAGIALGSDACAEHECGAKPMRLVFGCDESQDGIERRKIRIIPQGLCYLEGTKKVGDSIFLTRTQDFYRQPESWLKDPELKAYDEPLVCAWDENDFGIVAYGEEDRKNLKDIWEAFQKKDIAFWFNIGVFHSGGGLIFCIASRVPEKDKQHMFDSDLDYKELIKAAKETGIEEELVKAGKRWFSLFPKWAKEIHSTINGKVLTNHPVVFWLNPYDQRKVNYGWFTVEDLKGWIENKGIIPKTEEQKRR